MTSDDFKRLAGAARGLPPPLQEPVAHWLERLRELDPGAPALLREKLDVGALLRVAACSEFACNTMLRQWDWFAREIAARPWPGSGSPASAELAGLDVEAIEPALRRARNRDLLRILWRDLAGQPLGDTLAALSTLADRLILAAKRAAEAGLAARFGRVRGAGGQPLELVVLAMGKLGGRELNFSSDVDLIFLYPEDGQSDGPRALSAQQYFRRLCASIVRLLDAVTPDGFVYRVDTRLRPFGDSGPPVVSFGALESYLLRHGRGWERYAYVKARAIGGAPKDLLADVISPFVYRRYLDYGIFESLREMKALVAAEARKRQLSEDIKRGPGGIREIEFIVQSLQLVRGGSDRKLRTPELAAALRRLGRSGSIGSRDAAALGAAYRFLRKLENYLQALRDQQTHRLPEEPADRARLALAMGYESWDRLRAAVEEHRGTVVRQFEAVAFRSAEPRADDAGEAAAALWRAGAGQEEWENLLREAGHEDAAALAALVAWFAASGTVARIDRTAARRLARFVPAVIARLGRQSQPAIVLRRVLGIVEQVLRRSAYLALLNENPLALERLLELCGASGWLAEEVGRYPLLLDELLDPRLHSAAPSPAEMRAELAERLDANPSADSEEAIEILGRFQRATVFRIAAADIGGRLPVMKVSDRLTELAELVVENALGIAWRDLVSRHGHPWTGSGGRRRRAGFGIIAYGKFGGIELSYGSDLDLVFLHDDSGPEQLTDGPKPLDNNLFFARLVRRLVHFLTAQTISGALYQVDTRLRPSGRAGLLVTSVEAFARYQEQSAWTWEHQALLRSRPVAGSATVARDFERVRGTTLRFRVRRGRLAGDVRDMRARMRRELAAGDERQFDLKQGPGGIGDIEFLVQYLVLRHAERHPALIHYTDNIRQLGVLAAAGCLPPATAERMQEIYRAYRHRLHRLVLDGRPALADAGAWTGERGFVLDLWERLLGPG